MLLICLSELRFSSVAQSCPILCDPMNHSTPGLPVHHQLPEFTQTCPSSRWCHPAISSSVVPFSCPQSLPASGSFPMSYYLIGLYYSKYQLLSCIFIFIIPCGPWSRLTVLLFKIPKSLHIYRILLNMCLKREYFESKVRIQPCYKMDKLNRIVQSVCRKPMPN